MDKKTKGILIMAIIATVLSAVSVAFSILAGINIGFNNVNVSFYVNFIVLFVACTILWVSFILENKKANEPEEGGYDAVFNENIEEEIQMDLSENAKVEEKAQDIEE